MRLLIAIAGIILFPVAGPESGSHSSADQRAEAAPGARATLTLQAGATRPAVRALFARAGTLLVTASMGTGVVLWDVPSGRTLGRLLLEGGTLLAVSPDGRRIAGGLFPAGVGVWDVATGQCVLRDLRPGTIGAAASFSPDSRLVAYCAGGGQVRVWDLRRHRLRRVLRGIGRRMLLTAFSPSGSRLAIAGTGSPLEIWDWRAGRRAARLAPRWDAYSLGFSRDGRTLAAHGSNAAAGSRSERFGIWDAHTGRLRRSIAAYRDCQLSPDHRLLALPTNTGVRVDDISSGREVSRLSLGVPTYHLAFGTSARQMAVTSVDQSIHLWDLALVGNPRLLTGTVDHVEEFDISVDGSRVACRVDHARPDGPDRSNPDRWYDRGELIVWDLSAAGGPVRLAQPPLDASSVALSPDGTAVAAGCSDGRVRIWDVGGGAPVSPPLELSAEPREHAPEGAAVERLAYTADGQLLASQDAGGKIELWRVPARQRVGSWLAPASYLGSHGWPAPEIFTLARGSVHEWQPGTADPTRTFEAGPGERIYGFGAGPRGGPSVCTGGSNRLKLWEFGSHRLLWRVVTSTRCDYGATFGRATLAVGSSTGALTLRELGTGQQMGSVQSPTGLLPWLTRFGVGGRLLAALGLDDTVRIFAFRDRRLLEICALATFSGGSWAVVSPDGRYDSSHRGDLSELHWVDGSRSFPLERFASGRYVPGLLRRLMENALQPARRRGTEEND